MEMRGGGSGEKERERERGRGREREQRRILEDKQTKPKCFILFVTWLEKAWVPAQQVTSAVRFDCNVQM